MIRLREYGTNTVVGQLSDVEHNPELTIDLGGATIGERGFVPNAERDFSR